MRRPATTLRQLRLRGFIGLQVLMSAMLLTVLVHPLVYLLIAVQLALPPIGEGTIMTGEWMIWLAVFNLGLGLASTIGLGAIAVARRGWRGLAAWSLTQPLYWLMISIAGYRALVHLAVKPHDWENTGHGHRSARHRDGRAG
jgi:hypothetical protein